MGHEARTATDGSPADQGQRLGRESAVDDQVSRATVHLTGTHGATIHVPPQAAALNEATRLVPSQPATIPAPRPEKTTPTPAAEPPAAGAPAAPPAARAVERLRFGPGVPALLPATGSEISSSAGPTRANRRRERVLNGALTAALAAVVGWLLWPAGPLRVRQVSVLATPAAVSCGRTADVVATVRTNGRAGRLHYRWERNDGQDSGVLEQSLSKGPHAVDLRLRWAFHGPGAYAARATVQLLDPGSRSATVEFSYLC